MTRQVMGWSAKNIILFIFSLVSIPLFLVQADDKSGDGMIEVLQIDPSDNSPFVEMDPLDVSVDAPAAAARKWMHTSGGRIRTVKPGKKQTPALPSNSELEMELVKSVAEFFNGFKGGNDDYFKDQFHARYIQQIKKKWPGFAWVGEAYLKRLRNEGADIFRESLSIGVQIPLVGGGTFNPPDDDWHLLLRMMPVSGTFERFRVVNVNGQIRRLPGIAKVHYRPAVELDGSYKKSLNGHAIVPGLRFFIQTRADRFSEYRMIAEAYVKFDVNMRRLGQDELINDPVISSIRIIPRCILDLSEFTVPALNPEKFNRRHVEDIMHMSSRNITCSINAGFVFRN